MSSVDNRVVEMRFNNQQFENGVKTTVKSLGDLKKGLDLDAAAKNISNLERASSKFSLAGMASGIDAISSKFTALGIVGITALQNITNSAINAGKRIVSALTIDPIFAGFDEYETKMGAIQTILTNTASKGTTLDDVNKTLNELNEYSDQTIYNFAEMARNIGTFTAAGVDLKTSASSIKGIANLAAGSGSTSAQAATAMYQLSQAIAAGSVKLMDWNSVVNAGMGGELFQNALKKTAKGMGKVIDEGKPFRETLEQGWITTEVLTKTLAQFAEDESLVKAATQVKTFTQLFGTMKESVQSGWAQSWEAIIGDKNESTATLTAISDAFGSVVGASAKARNEMLSFWNANGGRTALLEGLGNALSGLAEILEPIEKAFSEIFPAITGQRLIELSKSFRDLTANFKIGEETANNIKSTFKGFFALLDIGKQAIFAIGNALISVIKYLFPVGDGFLTITGNIGDFIVAIRDALKSSDAFNVVFSSIGKVLKPIADVIKKIIQTIIDVFKSFGDIDLSGIDSVSERVKSRFGPLVKVLDFIRIAFAKTVDVLKKSIPFLSSIGDLIGDAFAKLKLSMANGNGFDALFDVVNGGLFAAILLGLRKFIKSLTGITDGAGNFLGGLTDILDGVKGSLEAYQSQLKAGTLLKIATAIGILAAALVALSLIDSTKLTVALSAMTVMFGNLVGSMIIFEKFVVGTGLGAMAKIIISMIAMSVAVLILTAAVTKLSKLDWVGIAKGLAGLAGSIGLLILSSKLLEKNSGGLIRSAFGITIFSASMIVLAEAVKRFGSMDLASITLGLTGMAIMLAEILIFKKLLSKNGSDLDIGLAVLAASMFIFSKAVKNFGDMKLNEIGKGLVTMAGALGIVAMVLRAMPPNMIVTGAGLVVIASSLIILSNALSNMGGMSLEGIAKGLVVMAGSLTIIAVAMTYMTSALPGAAALLVIAGALAILTPVLKTLGAMSLADVGTGLLALVGVFTVLGLAAYALVEVVPIIIALGAAITLFGIGIAATGVGVLAFSAALTALAVSGAAGAAALVVIITGIIGLIPMAAKSLAQGIIDFLKIIGNGSMAIAKSIQQIMVAIIDTLIAMIPSVVEGWYKLLDKILDTLLRYMPKLVDTGMKLVISFLEGIANNISKIYATGIKIVVNYINGIASMIPEVIDAGINLIISFINGLADGIRKNTDKMIAAMRNLMLAIVDAAVKALTSSTDLFRDIGINIVKGLINGMKSMVKDVVNAGSSLGSSVLSSAKKALGINSPSKFFKEIGQNIGVGLTQGITGSTKQAEAASTDMSKKVTTASSNVVKTSNEQAKKAFDKSVEWIDERKYYNQLSLQQELDAWERVQSRYIAGSDERKKADREVYRVKKELMKVDEEAAQKLLKDQFNNSTTWIDDNKYYNKLGLTEELAAWKRVQSRYLAGTEERKKADKEVYRLENELIKTNEEYSKQVLQTQKEANDKRKDLEDEYYDKTKEINDKLKQDIKSLSDEYEKAVETRANSLYNSYGLFDKVEAREKVSGSDLINNLKDQVEAFDFWQNNIKVLSIKGVDDGLIEELQALGPKSTAEIQALNNLSKSELDKYVLLWRKKHEAAKIQAVKELEGMRVETLNKITELQTDSSKELDEYRNMWAGKMLLLADDTDKQLGTIKTEWLKKMGDMRTDTENEFIKMVENVKEEITKPDWSALGGDIIGGIITGIKSESMTLSKEIANTAKATLGTLRDEWDMHSPSKEFAKVGMYAIEGLVVGIKKYSGLAMSAGSEIGKVTKDALKSTFGNMSTLLSSGLDNTPTIRPVLDMTNVENGLASTFSKTQGISVSGTISKAVAASSTSRSNSGGEAVTNQTDNTKNTDIKITNNYTVRSNDDIRKISTDLKNTLDRYNYAKGVAVV